MRDNSTDHYRCTVCAPVNKDDRPMLKHIPYQSVVLTLLFLFVNMTFASRAASVDMYHPTELWGAVAVQLATASVTQTLTTKPTMLPLTVNTWRDMMVRIPNAVDTTYQYLPPQNIIDHVQADWDDAVANQILNPPWNSSPERRARYYYTEIEETLTPTVNPKLPSPTPIKTLYFLGIGMRNFKIIGCNETGEICRISELWQQNYIRILDFVNQSIARGGTAPDKLTYVNLRWDERDGHWKMIKGTLVISNLETYTMTPKPNN